MERPDAEIVGIIPAAGYAARLAALRLEGAKELVTVRHRPVADHLVERMRAGGATRLRVITRPDKADVRAWAAAVGAEMVLATPPSAAASIAMGFDGLPADTVVLIGFPDTLWEPADGYRPLVAAVRSGADVALGLFHSDAPETGDVVDVDADGRVVSLAVKPDRPRTDRVWGCAAARVGALDGLSGLEHPGELFARMVGRQRIVGIDLGGSFVDIGNPPAYTRLVDRHMLDDHTVARPPEIHRRHGGRTRRED